MTPNTINISKEFQGSRLDKFLVGQMPEFSRSQIQKAIKDGLVLVNDKKSTVHQFLKEGDVVSIIARESAIADDRGNPRATDKKPVIATARNSSPRNDLIDGPKIIADEPGFLIIEKPAGLLVHPTEKNETDTLADWLVANYPDLRNIGEDPQRPAIVHRLDKEVSGLMIIPKTQDAFDYFKKQFQTRAITKKYTALVNGDIDKDEDEINFPIGRSKTNPGLFAARPNSTQNPDDKPARTIFSVLKRFKNFTLIEVQILTGRTHQIRVHMLAYGHPVAGDRLYGKKSKREPERIFLHASRLTFIDPSGRKREYNSPLPGGLQDFIQSL